MKSQKPIDCPMSAGNTITLALRIIDIICFVLAIVFSSIFFKVILAIDTCPEYLILGLSIIICVFVLKQDFIFWILSLFHSEGLKKQGKKTSFNIFSSIRPSVVILTLFRTVIFNAFYLAFPVIMIEFITLLIASFFNMVTFCNSVWGIIAVVGVLLTLFRFYVNGKKNAVNETISEVITKTQSIISSNISHIAFINWAEKTKGTGSSLCKNISDILDMQKELSGVIEKQSKRLQSNRTRNHISIKSLQIVSPPFPDSDTFYYKLENSNVAAGKFKNSELPEYYNEYFLEYCYNKIVDEIGDIFNFPEIGRILVTNVNIIDENGASITNITNFTKFVDYFENGINKKKDDTSDTAQSGKHDAHYYIKELTEKTLRYVFTELFSNFKKEKRDIE